MVSGSQPRIVFVLSILNFAFWFIAHAINVYQTAWVGAIFEILWIFMVILMLVLPVISLWFWRKEKFRFTSLYFYSMLVSISSFVMMGLQSK